MFHFQVLRARQREEAWPHDDQAIHHAAEEGQGRQDDQGDGGRVPGHGDCHRL